MSVGTRKTVRGTVYVLKVYDSREPGKMHLIGFAGVVATLDEALKWANDMGGGSQNALRWYTPCILGEVQEVKRGN